MVENLFELKTTLNRQGIFFGFSGPLSQDLLVEMGDILKQKMKLEEASSPTILKVFSMVVEQTQNILHYSADTIKEKDEGHDSELRSGIITVGTQGPHYFVQCGNTVDNRHVSELTKKLSRLQAMNQDELKVYYKEQRKQAPHDESKGAGLGFIEMARKASKPLEFDFRPIDDQYSFFTINAYI